MSSLIVKVSPELSTRGASSTLEGCLGEKSRFNYRPRAKSSPALNPKTKKIRHGLNLFTDAVNLATTLGRRRSSLPGTSLTISVASSGRRRASLPNISTPTLTTSFGRRRASVSDIGIVSSVMPGRDPKPVIVPAPTSRQPLGRSGANNVATTSTSRRKHRRHYSEMSDKENSVLRIPSDRPINPSHVSKGGKKRRRVFNGAPLFNISNQIVSGETSPEMWQRMVDTPFYNWNPVEEHNHRIGFRSWRTLQ